MEASKIEAERVVEEYLEAYRYEWGLGRAMDKHRAMEHYARAIPHSALRALKHDAKHRNLPHAQFVLAHAYLNEPCIGYVTKRLGLLQNYPKARRYFAKAAAQNNPYAQNCLGLMYANGLGVVQNYAEAVHWYSKAAAHNHSNAQNNLGLMYANGRGVVRNYAEALHWYSKAAAQNNSTAQNSLGVMYENGLGVDRNYAEALHWYFIAAAQNDSSAFDSMERLKDKISWKAMMGCAVAVQSGVEQSERRMDVMQSLMAAQIAKNADALHESDPQSHCNALSMVQHLGFADLRVAMGCTLLRHRSRAHRSSFIVPRIQRHISAAAAKYKGAFNDAQHDAALIDYYVSQLIGADLAKALQPHDVWVYLGHLHSLQGEFKIAANTAVNPSPSLASAAALVTNFEGFEITKALMIRVRSLFEMIIKVGKDQLNTAALFPPPIRNDKERLITTLQDELRYTLQSLLLYHDQALIHQQIDCKADQLEELELAHAECLLAIIGELKEGEGIGYPTGYTAHDANAIRSHVMYLHIARQSVLRNDCIVFRVDNLGDGVRDESTNTQRHTVLEDQSDRVYPFAYFVERKRFLSDQSAISQVLRITCAKWSRRDEAFGAIYNQSKYFTVMSKEQLTQRYPHRKVQQVPNCTVKNWHVGMQIRLRSLSNHHNSDALYRSLRKLEIDLIDTNHKKLSDDAMAELHAQLHQNAHERAQSEMKEKKELYESFKQSQFTQQIVHNAVQLHFSSKLWWKTPPPSHAETPPSSPNIINLKPPGSPLVAINAPHDPIILQSHAIIDHKDIVVGERLSEGGCGVVYKGHWDGSPVALNKLHEDLDEETIKEFFNEALITFSLRHPNVIQLFGYTLSKPHYAVMELMDHGSLRHVLNTESISITWPMRINYAKQIAMGVHYLHQRNIIHRDLKSMNVLVNAQGGLKLCDFGLAKVKAETSKLTGGGAMGSVAWLAPELLEMSAEYTKESDVFALGVLFWELASGSLPWNGAQNQYQIVFSVAQGKREPIPDHTPREFRYIITQCWAQQPADRPSTAIILTLLNSVDVSL